VKATRPQLDRALKSPAAVRLFLFHGPDESSSRELARRIPLALGPETERVELSGPELKGDPACLTDEAAAISMFGTGRFILVAPAGDDTVEAAAALLDAPAAGNPVALVAGALKATSKLLKLALAHPAALVFASYPLDARDLDRLVADLAQQRGLSVRPDVATRIAVAAAGDRAIIERELDKYALYLDAAPGRAVALDSEAVAAVGASLDDGDLTSLVTALFGGNARGVETELARLRSEGTEGITLLRAALRRALSLARSGGESEAGWQGRGMGRDERGAVTRQASAWPPGRLARALGLLLEAENEVKAPAGLGPLTADAAMLSLARQASRRS
jgi:DNA polymerase III subunit delta